MVFIPRIPCMAIAVVALKLELIENCFREE